MLLTPSCSERRPVQVFVDLGLWHVRQDRDPGRCNAQREANPLMKHKRAHREAALFPLEADRLVTSPCREERALAGQPRERSDAVQGQLRDVEGIGGDSSHDVNLGADQPGPAGATAIHEPLEGERGQQPMSRLTRQSGALDNFTGGDPGRGCLADRSEDRGDAGDHLCAWRRRSDHNVVIIRATTQMASED